MKKIISTLAIIAALSLGIWTVAVTFTPIAANFTDGDSVSAAAFNALFDAIEANFGTAETAINTNETAINTNETAIDANSTAIDANSTAIDANSASITQLESDVATATTVAAARVIKATNQNVNNNQLTTVNWTFEDFDTDALHDNASNNSRITVPEDGLYLVSAEVSWIATALGGRLLGIYENGSTFPTMSDSVEGPDGTVGVSGPLQLSAGDFVEVKVFQSSGSAADVSSTAQSWFSVVKLGDLP